MEIIATNEEVKIDGGDKVIKIKAGLKNCHWMTIILMSLLVIVTIYPSRMYVILYIGVALIFTFKQPVMGLVGWIMGYPYFNIFTDATGILGYFILSPLVVLAFLSHILKKNQIQIPVKIIVFGMIMTVTAATSLLFSGSRNSSIISFGMLLMAVFILIVIINIVKANPENFFVLNEAYIFAVIAIFLSTLMTDGLFGVGRLSLGESIRRVANVTSPAIIILYIELLLRLSKNEKTILNRKRPLWMIIVLFLISIIVLLSTVSRGALMAVVITGFFVFIFNTFLNKAKGNPIGRIPLYALGTALILWAIRFVEQNIAGAYLSRARVSNFGGNLRWDIWKGAIEQMAPYEYIIGAGPNVFRELALLSGFDFYAHSVFIDTFVTLGILGLLALSLFIVSIFLKSIKNKNMYSFGMIVLLLWLYSTHGNLTGSLDFWTLLGMVYVSLSIKEIRLSKGEIKRKQILSGDGRIESENNTFSSR